MLNNINPAGGFCLNGQLVDKTPGLAGTQSNGSTYRNPNFPPCFSDTGPEPKEVGGQRHCGRLIGREYLESPMSLEDRNSLKKRKLSAAALISVDLSLSLGVKVNDALHRKEEEEKLRLEEVSSEIVDDLSLSLCSAATSKPDRASRLTGMSREADSSGEVGMSEHYSCSSNGGLMMMVRASTLDLTL